MPSCDDSSRPWATLRAGAAAPPLKPPLCATPAWAPLPCPASPPPPLWPPALPAVGFPPAELPPPLTPFPVELPPPELLPPAAAQMGAAKITAVAKIAILLSMAPLLRYTLILMYSRAPRESNGQWRESSIAPNRARLWFHLQFFSLV